MPFLQRDNVQMYYTEEPAKWSGDADETIMLLHTNLTDHTIFDSMIPVLNESFHIVRYDLRGFGLSELGGEELSLDLYVEDLKFLITSLRLQSVHLVGFGFGALIALKFNTLHEELVKKMSLMTMACFPEESYRSVKAHRNKISHKGTKIPVGTLIKKVSSLTTDDPEYTRLHGMMSNVPISLYTKIMDLTLYTNPIPYIHKTTKSALLLGAEQEVVFPQNLLTLTASYLKNFHYTVVPNASSFLMIDQPEITAKLVTAFLTTDNRERYTDDMITNEIYENVRMYTENFYRKGAQTEQSSNEIRIDLLYSFQVEINGHRIIDGWNRRYTKHILLYLLFHQTVSREQLCEQLWPENPLQISKNNLRVYLYHLKRMINTYALNEPILTFDREHVYLNGDISSNALVFISEVHQAVREENETVKYERVNKIISQLTSTNYLLVIFDDWFLELRNKVEDDLISLAVWMGKWLIKSGKWQAAKRHLRKAATIFDDNEEIYDVPIELQSQISDNELDDWMKEKESRMGA